MEFPALTTERTIQIRILDDARVEGERYTVVGDENVIVYTEGFVIDLGLEASEVLTNDTEGRSAQVNIVDDDNAPLVMSADNVTEGQSIQVRIGVDPASGGCDATFPFLVDLSLVSQTQGTVEGDWRTGNTLGPTPPATREVRLESCADTAIEAFQTVENTTDEGERDATFRLSNLRRASATNPPAGTPLRVVIADGIESVSVYDNDASSSDYVAVTDYAHVPPGTRSIDIDVLKNDFVRNSRKDAITITWASEPPSGRVEITREWITYTPDEGFSGRDGFVYQVDVEGLQSTGLVQVDVQGEDEPGWVATWTGNTMMSEGGTGLTVAVTNQNTGSTRTGPAYINLKVRALDAGAGPSDLEVVQGSGAAQTVLTDRLLGTMSRETGSGQYIGNYGGAISIVAKTDTQTEYTERMVLELFAEGRRVNNGQREIAIANQQSAVPNAPTVNVASATRDLRMNEGDSRAFQIELSQGAANDLEVSVVVTSNEGPDGYLRFDKGHIGPRTVRFSQGQTTATVEMVSHADTVVSVGVERDARRTKIRLKVLPGIGYVVGTNPDGEIIVRDGSYVEERDDEGELTGNVVFDPNNDQATVEWLGTECNKDEKTIPEPIRVREDKGVVELGLEVTKGQVSRDFALVLVNREGGAARDNDYVDEDATGTILVKGNQLRSPLTVEIVKTEQVEPRTESFEISLFRNGVGERINIPCPIVKIEIIDEDEVNFTLGDRVRRVTEGQSIDFTGVTVGESGRCLMPRPVTIDINPVAGATDVLAQADRTQKELRLPPCTYNKTTSFATVETSADQGPRTVYFDAVLSTQYEPERVRFEDGFETVRYTVHIDDSTATSTTTNEVRGVETRSPGKKTGKPAPRPTPVTAAVRGLPMEHDGATAFKFELHFSPAPRYVSYRTVRDSLWSIGNGEVTKARRLVRKQHQGWEVTVTPHGDGDVAIRLNPTPECEASGAICSPSGGALERGLIRNVRGPTKVSVADARTREAEGATLEFEVSLSRALDETFTVAYTTSDGTARSGEDYGARAGTLALVPGTMTRTVSVPVIDDTHDEGSETLTLTLSNPSPSRVKVARASATGTISNSDPMPRAWSVRLGRTIASQVVDALGERLEGTEETQVTVGGARLEKTPDANNLTAQGERPGWKEKTGGLRPAMTATEVVLQSAFHWSSLEREDRGQPGLSAWGRFVTGGFEAQEDEIALDGDVTTGIVGFDAKLDRGLAGVMLSISEGDGGYQEVGEGEKTGELSSTMTGIYPYARLDVNERVFAWGTAGFGSGELRLEPRGERSMETDLSMRMGAVGIQGQVLDGNGPSRIALNTKSDLMWVSTRTRRTDDLVATKGNVTRVRVMIQGERVFAMDTGATVTPSAQAGLRHDAGQADKGLGVELGAGIRYRSGALSMEGRVRTLISHEASGYDEWGASAAIRVTPTSSGRGLGLTIAPQWGESASAAHRLWSAQGAGTTARISRFEPTGRVVMEASYGVGLGGPRGVLTPYAGMTLGPDAHRAVHAGTRWKLGQDIEMALEASRRAQGNEGTEVRAKTIVRF